MQEDWSENIVETQEALVIESVFEIILDYALSRSIDPIPR
jgi:hypothetical protein